MREKPEALALSMAEMLERFGGLTPISSKHAKQIAVELRRLYARVQELEGIVHETQETLEFVERWAVHHGSKPTCSAKEALSVIQHYSSIRAITDSYSDGKPPTTFDPYARIAELEKQLEAIGAGGVEALRTKGARDD